MIQYDFFIIWQWLTFWATLYIYDFQFSYENKFGNRSVVARIKTISLIL